MKTIPGFLSILFLLFACVPSEQATPMPISTPTEPAKVAITNIGVLPTKTPTPTATMVPSITPDLSIIPFDPENFLLDQKDLPIVGEYYLPNNGLSPLRNSEIIQELWQEKGEEYIQETGRLDGWVVTYQRGSRVETIPQVITDKVSMFETTAGAQLSITLDTEKLSSNYREVLSPVTIGDFSRGYSYSRNNYLNFIYYFSYKNYVHILEFSGNENEVTFSLVDEIANKLLDKLLIAQFSEQE